MMASQEFTGFLKACNANKLLFESFSNVHKMIPYLTQVYLKEYAFFFFNSFLSSNLFLNRFLYNRVVTSRDTERLFNSRCSALER